MTTPNCDVEDFGEYTTLRDNECAIWLWLTDPSCKMEDDLLAPSDEKINPNFKHLIHLPVQVQEHFCCCDILCE